MKDRNEMNLQKTGGISAIVSTASYIFGIGLFATLMTPLNNPELGFNEYMTFLISHKSLIFIWNFLIYIVHGAALVILVLAYYERLKESSPRLAKVGASFGLIWTGLVLLSGFITISGSESLITLYETNPGQAEILKNIFTKISMGIDISDKYIGSLWIAMVSIGAMKKRVFPQYINIIGLLISIPALFLGLILPVNTLTGSLVFGMGALVWWLVTGIHMIRKPKLI